MQNFNQARLNLFDAIEQQQKQINSLKEDIERLRANPKATPKLIFFKEQQVKVFEAVIETLQETIALNDDIFSKQQKEIKQLSDDKFKLEGICLYHGISNLKFYMHMKTEQLIKTVTQAFNEGWRQTPFDIKEDLTRGEIKEMTRLLTQARQIEIQITNTVHGKKTN